MTTMRAHRRYRAIRNVFDRLGLQSTPAEVVDALAKQGVRASEELVRQVRVELLRENTGGKNAEVRRPVISPGVRRNPRRVPGQRGNK